VSDIPDPEALASQLVKANRLRETEFQRAEAYKLRNKVLDGRIAECEADRDRWKQEACLSAAHQGIDNLDRRMREHDALQSKLGGAEKDAEALLAECNRLKAERDEARSRLDTALGVLAAVHDRESDVTWEQVSTTGTLGSIG
jgi:chromosome segregation ATPase